MRILGEMCFRAPGMGSTWEDITEQVIIQKILYKTGGVTKMIESIDQCYVCKDWYNEPSLQYIKIPDQNGYVKKPICKACLHKIEVRSSGLESRPKSGQLLMEGER